MLLKLLKWSVQAMVNAFRHSIRNNEISLEIMLNIIRDFMTNKIIQDLQPKSIKTSFSYNNIAKTKYLANMIQCLRSRYTFQTNAFHSPIKTKTYSVWHKFKRKRKKLIVREEIK